MARTPLPTDTAQSILSINITGVEGVQEYLETSKKNVLRLADNLTTKTATEARKTAAQDEEHILHLGKQNIKWDSSKGGYKAGGSRWDSALGAYTSRRETKKGKYLRLINFKNTKTAAYYEKSKGFNQDPMGNSVVRMTSTLANLWENDAYYEKPSALWYVKGNKYARWKAGTRQGKHYFTRVFTNAVNGAIPTAITEAEKKFKEDQRKARLQAKENKG